MKPTGRARILAAVRWLVALLALGLLARYLWINADRLRTAELELRTPALLLSFLILLVYMAGRSLAWHYITSRLGVAVSLRSSFASWNYSLLGKYLPGKVFLLLGRLDQYQRADKPLAKVTLAFFLETVSTLMASVLTILLALLIVDIEGISRYQPASWILLAILLAAMHPWLLSRSADLALRVLRKPRVALDLRLRDSAAFVGVATVNWLVFGVAFYLMVDAIYPLDPSYLVFLAGAISFASLVGILAVVVPSGLGVREGVLALLLAQVMPAPVAAMISLASRLWVTVGEAAAIGLGVVLSRRGSPPEPVTERAGTDQAPPPRAQDLGPVIASGMCIGCGACVMADPSLRLRLDPLQQTFGPSGPGNAAAAAVCPAVAVDFLGLQEKVFPGCRSTEHGVVEAVLLAQSTDHDRNLKASSGGLIKELLLDYLERGEVDGVIALKEVAGLRFEPDMITGIEEVDSLPGSIYHSVDLSGALRLLAENEGRFVIVAIPCQLEGIYNYVYQMAPHLAERIAGTIGLLCGWLYSHHAIRAICELKGIDFDGIQRISYRGGGPVGPLRVVTGDREWSISRRVDFDYQVAFDRSFNIPRCHVCINHGNFLADIVVGDAWLPSTVGTKTGISLLICRKPETVPRVRRLAERQRIRLTDVTVDEIVESQTRRVVFGDFAYAYADYRREIGAHTPAMTGPNRAAARLAGRAAVARFHRELTRKLELQRQFRYRRLWWRKATLELPRFAKRYVVWFLVRILKVKSLVGRRKEVSREEISIFR